MRKFKVREYTTSYYAVVVPLDCPVTPDTWICKMNDLDRETLLEAILFRLVVIEGFDPNAELLSIYNIAENAMSGRIKDLEGFEFEVEGEQQ